MISAPLVGNNMDNFLIDSIYFQGLLGINGKDFTVFLQGDPEKDHDDPDVK